MSCTQPRPGGVKAVTPPDGEMRSIAAGSDTDWVPTHTLPSGPVASARGYHPAPHPAVTPPSATTEIDPDSVARMTPPVYAPGPVAVSVYQMALSGPPARRSGYAAGWGDASSVTAPSVVSRPSTAPA